MPRPRPCQLAWQEAEFGVLVCYELHTFNPGRYRQGRARVTPVADVNQFNPVHLAHVSQPSRVKSAVLVLKRISQRTPNDPFVAMSDFNIDTAYEGRYPSDHFPVSATLYWE